MVSIRVCISMYPGVPSATFRLPTPKSCQPPHPHAQMVLLRRLGQALDDAEERQDVGGLENSGSLPSREERRGLLDDLETSHCDSPHTWMGRDVHGGAAWHLSASSIGYVETWRPIKTMKMPQVPGGVSLNSLSSACPTKEPADRFGVLSILLHHAAPAPPPRLWGAPGGENRFPPRRSV